MKSINIRFPLEDDTEKNRYFRMNGITKDAFSSDLLLLLLTERGERYYEPDYGTNLLKFLFEPNDNITEQDIDQEIKRTVSLYIPNLSIDSISFNDLREQEGDSYKDHTLNVHIRFTYTEDAFSESGVLDLNF